MLHSSWYDPLVLLPQTFRQTTASPRAWTRLTTSSFVLWEDRTDTEAAPETARHRIKDDISSFLTRRCQGCIDILQCNNCDKEGRALNKEQPNTSRSYHASSSIALDSVAPAPDFFFFLLRFLFAAVSRIAWNGTRWDKEVVIHLQTYVSIREVWLAKFYHAYSR